MRRFDKKLNIQKANLLAEQRYFELKKFINEDFDNKLIPVGSKIQFNGKDGEVIEYKTNLNNEIFYLIRYNDGSEEYAVPRDKRIKSINESFNTPITNNLNYGDSITWLGDDKIFSDGKSVKKGDQGSYIGKDENGYAVSFSKNFYAGETDFKKN